MNMVQVISHCCVVICRPVRVNSLEQTVIVSLTIQIRNNICMKNKYLISIFLLPLKQRRIYLFVSLFFLGRDYIYKKNISIFVIVYQKNLKQFYHFKLIKDEEEHDEDADSAEDEAASNERFQIKERIAKKLKIDTSENTKQQLQEEETKTERKTTSRR